MIKINRNSKLTFLSILAILSLSTIMPALVFAAPIGNNGADWQYVNGNSWAGNYSPQTQINADNVNDLEVKWLFPLADNTNVPAGISMITPGTGSNTPPVVIDGKVIVQTNFQRLIAIDAKTGRQLWTHDYTENLTEAAERLPISYASTFLLQHIHGIRTWESGNAVVVSGLACDFYGVDLDTGEESFHVNDLCIDIPGNMYNIAQGSVSTTNIGTYEAGRMFITVLPGVLHSGYSGNGDFRHTTIGVDMDTHEIVWRLFDFPPHGVLSKDWALQECDVGWFRDIPCSTVAEQAPENLEWDWAKVDSPPDITAGVTANWGQIIVDEDTGIVYTNTGNQGPYTYIGETPGPRLYGSTIMAIDGNTGQRLWWSQPMPRDPYDYDCNWGGFLADVPTIGKVYTKGCKEGRLHILDAATGTPVHIIDVVDEQYARGQITEAGTKEYPEGGIKYRTMDPLNHYDMREMTQPADSPYCGNPCVVYTSFYNGIFGTDPSFNPATGTIFHWTQAAQTGLLVVPDPPWEVGQSLGPTWNTGAPQNTTIVARDIVSGEEIWTWYYDTTVVRSHIVTTSNIIFTGFADGYMRFLHAETGEMLREINLGGNLGQIGSTTGADSDGNQKIFSLVITGTAFGQSTPGTLVALGLNDRAQAAATVTVTSTSRTTLTSTSTSVSTTTATSTSTSVTTTTAQGQTQTQTQTVTSEITEETIGTITYAAVAVAVIAIIGAALIYTKKITI